MAFGKQFKMQKLQKFWALRKKRAKAWLALNEWAEMCLSEKKLDSLDYMFRRRSCNLNDIFFPKGILELCEKETKRAWRLAK